MKTEAHISKRLTYEAWFINSHPHVMNRSTLPQTYCRLTTIKIPYLLILVAILISYSCVEKIVRNAIVLTKYTLV